MDSIGSQTVVVGVDGSTTSDAALEWAVADASARGLSLHVVSAGVYHGEGPKAVHSDAAVEAQVAREALAAADARVAAATARALVAAPGLLVTSESSLDRAADILVALSARAHAIVVGRSGHGPVVGAVLGSVASRVVTHALCPVVVVQEPGLAGTGEGGVAVGVDGSAHSELALAHAFDQASARGVGLHVIHAWWTRATAGRTPATRADQVAQERLTLSEAMVGWAETYPDVEVRVSMPIGPAVLAITEAAHEAELLVVGSRGRGSVRGLLLGSVSRGVLKHAPCTVVVVRERDPDHGRMAKLGAAVHSRRTGR